jgi:hypothetical protein
MNQDRFAVSLQQDLLTILCWSDDHGKTVAKIVSANLFEGDFRTIAQRAIDFWQSHNTAPKQHIADLLADILEDPADRRAATYRRILVQMLEVKDQINTDFVLKSMGSHVRVQQAKGVILQSAEKLDALGINGIRDVESLWRDFLKEGTNSLDPGLRLSDIDKVLEYFARVHSEFKTGIKELDEANIVPMRGKIWVLLAPSGYGKSWLLTQLGKMAFVQRKKVLHVTLEIETEEVLQRYYQALFGASKRDNTNKVSTLKFDRNGDLDQIVSTSVEVPFTFMDESIRDELYTRVGHFGTRADNIIVKRFPMRSLTVDQLEAYLENLEALEDFVPDLVIVDYPGIMKTDEKNHRISMGRLIENLRGLSQRRDFALAAAHQSNRISVEADMVKATHMAEDWSVVGTSDFIVTYSQTDAERQRGLARLYVAKARSENDKFGVLLSQSYRTGQFVLESMRMSDQYAKLMESMGTTDDEELEDEE